MEISTILICIGVYIISFIFNWLHFRICYSEGGIYENSLADRVDLFATVCPVLNTICLIIFLFINPRKTSQKERQSITKFFKSKNNEKVV